MWATKTTFVIRRVSKVASGELTMKTKRILSKRSESKNGSIKAELENLISSISLAKGLLATLSTNDPSAWTRKCQTSTAREHTRILLQEVMEEIWKADHAQWSLSQELQKNF